MVHGVAPRSVEASSAVADIRRSRAEALFTTITMQNVACPATRVKNVSPPRAWVNSVFSAMPVTMPGSAIGQQHEQRHRVAAEEVVAHQRHRGERAQHHGDRGRAQRHLHRRHDRGPDALVGRAPPATSAA